MGGRFANHKGDKPVPVPATRDTTPSTKPLTALGAEIERLREGWGLTYKEIAELISDHTGIATPQTTVYSWLRDCDPRRIPISEIYEAIRKAKAKTEPFPTGAWVSPEVVSPEIKEILSQVDIALLSDAAGVPIRTMRSWTRGRHRVHYSKWDAVKTSAEALGYTSPFGS